MTPPLQLDRWFWRSFLRTALLPLLVIELGFLLIYWLSAQTIYEDNRHTVAEVSKAFMPREVQAESQALSERLNVIATLSGLLAAQTRQALQTPYPAGEAVVARYQQTEDGALMTPRDLGGAAAFHSGYVALGPAQRELIVRSVQLDPFLKQIKAAHPLIAQVYLNTRDSYNRIYPYFDVKGQYPVRMNIPSYNFYYEADARHNPARKPVWTDAYLDPAGQGWMVSSIAPVWLDEQLAAVVGIDITLNTVVDKLLKLDLPWNAYAMLVGRDGTILALPPKGENDWGLREVGLYHYTSAVQHNVFKPAQYRIDLHPAGKHLARAMASAPQGMTTMTLSHGGRELVAWSRVAGPDWTMLLVAEEPAIQAQANQLYQRMTTVGWFMLSGLLLFYLLFFSLLARRARSMSQQVLAPLHEFQQVVERIGNGDYRQVPAQQKIAELDALGQHIAQLATRLQQAAEREEHARQQVAGALDSERRLNQQQQHFIEVLSHEVRTPLAQIDSLAQALQRRGSSLAPEVLAQRLGGIRTAGASLAAMLERSLQALLPVAANGEPYRVVSLARLLDQVAQQSGLGEALHRQLPLQDGPPLRESLLHAVLLELAANAVQHGGACLQVSTQQQDGQWLLRLHDAGPALPPEELSLLVTPFYRCAGDRAQGSGLGLTMVSRFVTEMGGRLVLDSAEGQGLIVSIYLPLTGHEHG